MASPAAAVQEKMARERVRPDDRLERLVAGLNRRFGERITGELALRVLGLLGEA